MSVFIVFCGPHLPLVFQFVCVLEGQEKTDRKGKKKEEKGRKKEKKQNKKEKKKEEK